MNVSFITYSQQELLEKADIVNYVLNTIVDNLSYIFGADMDSPQSRNEWIKYNLKTVNSSWRIVLANKNDVYAGFIIYTIHNRTLSVYDIEINKTNRYNPTLLKGLLKTVFENEYNNFDNISGYINKKNETSQHNFLKYASQITETERGYKFLIDKNKTEILKTRLLN